MANSATAIDQRERAVEEVAARATEHPLLDTARFLFRVLRDGPRPHRQLTVRVEPSLGIVTSEIVSIESRPEAVEVRTQSLGLFGASSPLPHYIVEELEAPTPRARAARGLLDAIHERLLRIYLEGVDTLDIPEAFVQEAHGYWHQRLIAVLGLVGPAAELPTWRIMAMAPALLHGRGSRFSLEMAIKLGLEDLLGEATVCVKELSGGWTERAQEQLSRLGTNTALLGETYFCGTHVYHPSASCDIRIAGLSEKQMEVFKEGALGYELVQVIAGVAASPAISVRLVIEVAPRQYPVLGARKLGEDFWFPSGSATERPLEYLLDSAEEQR